MHICSCPTNSRQLGVWALATCSYTPRLDGDPCALIDEGEDSSVVQNDIQRCCIDALIKYIRLLLASPTMAKLRSLRVVFHRQRSVAQS